MQKSGTAMPKSHISKSKQNRGGRGVASSPRPNKVSIDWGGFSQTYQIKIHFSCSLKVVIIIF